MRPFKSLWLHPEQCRPFCILSGLRTPGARSSRLLFLPHRPPLEVFTAGVDGAAAAGGVAGGGGVVTAAGGGVVTATVGVVATGKGGGRGRVRSTSGGGGGMGVLDVGVVSMVRFASGEMVATPTLSLLPFFPSHTAKMSWSVMEFSFLASARSMSSRDPWFNVSCAATF